MDATSGAAITTAIATVVLTVITGYYAWQTRQVTREARDARQLVALPVLIASVRLNVTTILYVQDIEIPGVSREESTEPEPNRGPPYEIKGAITVRNVGDGPALDVELHVHVLNADKSDIDVTRVHEKLGILATKARTLDLGVAFREGYPEHPVVEIAIKYSNLHKRRLETHLQLTAVADPEDYPSRLTWTVVKEEFGLS